MAALKVSSSNGVKVYNCTAGKSTPQWHEDAAKKRMKGSLRYNEDYRRRIDLIEDFQFPATSNRIKMSPDGAFICVSGMYGPQIKMYETSQLSMKFERHIDAEVLEFQFLSADFRKLALLRCDRTVEIHAAYGRHHQLKIPRFGRDLLYESANCDLYVAAAGSEVYRINLEQGRFLSPLVTNFSAADNASGRKGGVSCCGINPMHHLLAFGAEEKDVVEMWDPRDRNVLSSLSLSASLKGSDAATASELERAGAHITSLRFHDTDGLTFAVGTSSGHVLLYDLRSSTPMLVKDHRYGLPIIDLKFASNNTHTQSSVKNVLSSDAKIIKVWNQQTGDIFTNIETQANINDVCLHPNSGLLMCAGEQSRMQVYYVPSLGPAPKWCSFLDSLTEELEEKTEASLFDDYKFLTRTELEQWGMEHLIGTNVLRAYMHGFFMDMRLYNRIKSMTTVEQDGEKSVYEAYMKKKIEEKMKNKIINRSVIKKLLPTVNTEYAKTLLNQPRLKKQLKEEQKSGGASTGAAASANTFSNPLGDTRFTGIFSNRDFEINPESEEFQRLNPAAAAAGSKGRKRSREEEEDEEDAAAASGADKGADDRFDLVDQGEEDDDDGDDGDDAAEEGAEDSDEDFVHKKSGASSNMAIAKLAQRISSKASKPSSSSLSAKGSSQPAMYELKQGFTAANLLDSSDASKEAARRARGMTMGERMAHEEEQAIANKQRERWAVNKAQRREEGGAERGGRGGRGGFRGRGGNSGAAESGRKGRGMESVMGRERASRGGFGAEGGGRGRGGRGGRGGGGRGGGRGRGR